jgi:hypothetical protein
MTEVTGGMSSGDDSKFLIREFVMPTIERIDRKLESICNGNLETRLTVEQVKAKIALVEMMVIKVQESVELHKKDMIQHYNPYYNETLPEKIWRKKPEILAGGGLGALTITVIQWIVEHVNF